MTNFRHIEEWKTRSTHDLISDGKLIIGDGYRAKNSELSSSGLPFARAANINGGFHFENADRLPEEDLGKVGAKVSEVGDVVFTSKGTVGRFAFVTEQTPRFVYAPQLCYWRALDPDTIDERFLYYWMQGDEFRRQVAAVKGQTDMADYVSLTDQRRMRITLPPVETQRSIAAVLGALDDKIEYNHSMVSALQRFARAIFRAWFIDFEPVTAKADRASSFPSVPEQVFLSLPDSFVDSEVGRIPDGWSLSSLDDVATFLNGLALQKYPPRGNGTDLRVIKIAQLRRMSTEGADLANADVPEQYVINDGDLLFSWSGTLETTFWYGGIGALNQHIFKVTPSGFPSWFCHLWIDHHLPWFRAIAAGKATTMGHIKRSHLSEAKVVVPNTEALQGADELLGPMYELQARMFLESRQLARVRDEVLRGLLTRQARIVPSTNVNVP